MLASWTLATAVVSDQKCCRTQVASSEVLQMLAAQLAPNSRKKVPAEAAEAGQGLMQIWISCRSVDGSKHFKHFKPQNLINLKGRILKLWMGLLCVSGTVFSAYAQDDVEGPPRKVEAPEGLPPGRAYWGMLWCPNPVSDAGAHLIPDAVWVQAGNALSRPTSQVGATLVVLSAAARRLHVARWTWNTFQLWRDLLDPGNSGSFSTHFFFDFNPMRQLQECWMAESTIALRVLGVQRALCRSGETRRRFTRHAYELLVANLNGGALTSETHYRAGTTVSCFRLVSARSVPDQFSSSWFPLWTCEQIAWPLIGIQIWAIPQDALI